MLVGYARTSGPAQVAGFEAQIVALKAAGCEKLFQEQVSSVKERSQLDAALEFIREGDTFICTKMDRLARSTQDLLRIVTLIESKGASLKILDFGGEPVATRSPQGKLMLTVFAAFAQFEREVMLERQKDGIAQARVDGKYKGRKPTAMAKSAEVIALHRAANTPAMIAREVGIGRASVYRILSSAGLFQKAAPQPG
jgi:DNA invertase Pin-like site-specific DNA recombinase